MAGTVSEERELMSADLQTILRGAAPRKYGEAPRCSGSFDCIAPSPLHDKLVKLRRPLPQLG